MLKHYKLFIQKRYQGLPAAKNKTAVTEEVFEKPYRKCMSDITQQCCPKKYRTIKNQVSPFYFQRFSLFFLRLFLIAKCSNNSSKNKYYWKNSRVIYPVA